jgi:hypothetical protein
MSWSDREERRYLVGMAVFLFILLTVFAGRHHSVGDFLFSIAMVTIGMTLGNLLASRRLPTRAHAALLACVAVILVISALT